MNKVESSKESGEQRVLGLNGYFSSGKDTAARVLEEMGWGTIAFADKVREMVLAINPYVVYDRAACVLVRLSELIDEYGWDYCKRTYPEVRRLMQATGTEGGRQVIGERVWIDKALEKFRQFDLSTSVVFTDVRYPDEEELVRGLGGLIVKITRPGCELASDHSSETMVDQVKADFTISNESVEYLQHEIRLLAAVIP